MAITLPTAEVTLFDVTLCSRGNAERIGRILRVGTQLIVQVKMISHAKCAFILLLIRSLNKYLIDLKLYLSITSLSLAPPFKTSLYFNTFHAMSIPNQIKPADSAQDSNAIVRPHTYEMRHYPHDGILEQLAFMLIRPPRFVYNPDILLPSRRTAQRFSVESLKLPFEATFYRQKEMDYVLLYLHGNGSSRFQGTLFLSYLPERVGLVCFDFKGCGNRPQGEYITLGQEQAKDVDIVAAHLKSAGYRVVGWGRSMGGVSLLMSQHLDIMVCDSAYANLGQLCKESSSKFMPKACCCLFHCLFPCVFACIQCKANALAGLQIDRMDVTARVETLAHDRQICFIHGEADMLVPVHHAEQLYAAFRGRKEIILFQGTHNSIRPKEVLQKCFEFIAEALKRSKISTTSNSKLTEMMVELPSIPPSKHETKNEHKMDLLEHSPMHHRKLLSPINQKPQISPNKQRPQQEQYCEIGPESKLPINETFPEEEPFQKMSRKSEEEGRRLQQCKAESPCLRL